MIEELILGAVAIPLLKKATNKKAKRKSDVRLPKYLTREQRENALKIIRMFGLYGDGDPRKLAYILSTALWESNLKPVKEVRARYDKNPSLYTLQNRYWKSGYYGRGFVQITWPENYRKMSNATGYDLSRYPDLALNPDIAARIIVQGMMEGLFSGKALDDYIPLDGKADYYNARRVVNVLDRAKEIAYKTKDFLI